MFNLIDTKIDSLVFMARPKFEAFKEKMLRKLDRQLVSYNVAWFIVLLAVLMTIAFTVASALAVWCVVKRHGSYVGKWHWSRHGVKVKAACKRR